MAWWQEFAQKWNGVEAIPQAVSIPWRWLSSDASGDKGLGLFLCGAAVHIPLPLDLLRSQVVAKEERELIIAETELIAAVLVVALAAPLFPTEHLLVGIDNTVAISWMDKGTAPRPRAMRALRLLWRIQAHHRVSVSTRYIPSDQNTLADAASRLDVSRFRNASQDWLAEHGSSCRDDRRLNTGSRASLVSSFYGADGGSIGLVTQYLVEGVAPSVSSIKDVERALKTIAEYAPDFVRQKHRTVCGANGSLSLFCHSALRSILGKGRVLHLSCVESLFVPRDLRKTCEAIRCEQRSWLDSWRAYAKGGPRPEPPLAPKSVWLPGPKVSQELIAAQENRDLLRQAELLGLRAPRAPLGPQARKFIEDLRGRFVPINMLEQRDLAMATPIIPESIKRAVFDQSYDTLRFAVPATEQSRCPPSPAACVANAGRRASGCDPPP
jgi:hypothetical protein